MAVAKRGAPRAAASSTSAARSAASAPDVPTPTRRPSRAIMNTSSTPAARQTRPAHGASMASVYGVAGVTPTAQGAYVKDGSTPKNERPDFTRDEVARWDGARDLVNDFVLGTTAVHAKAKTYLPAWPDEDPDLYQQRKTFTTVFGATERVVIASLGLVTGDHPPALAQDADALLVEHAKNIDGAGQDLGTFLRTALREQLVSGLAGILVDFSENPSRVESDASQQRAERRPFWHLYKANQIRNWRVGWLGGERVLNLLVLREQTMEPDGEYGLRQVTRYREFRLVFGHEDPAVLAASGIVFSGEGVVVRPGVLWRLWREDQQNGVSGADGGKTWTLERDGWVYAFDGKAFGEIPFAPCYGQVPDEPLVCRPPLEALARRNHDYHRVENDRRWCMTLTHAPMAELRGRKMQPDGKLPPFKIRPAGYVDFSDSATAGMQWRTVPSDALAQSAQELDRLKAEMASLSLAYLLTQTTGQQETATGKRITTQAGFASLALTAQGTKDGAERAVRFHVRYLRNVAPCAVEVPTDFDRERMAPEVGTLIVDMMKENKLTRVTGLRQLQKGGILDESVDVEAEDATLDEVEQALQEYALELQRSVSGAGDPNAEPPRDPNADPAADPTASGDPAPAPARRRRAAATA